MQLWPAKENAFAASRVETSSRSASASTITGVAFPSSSFTRLRGARSASFQPTSPEPVKVIARTRSSSTSTSPISEAGPTTTFSHPGGSSASVSSSASRSAEKGVCDAGFRTTAQPAASAGPILCATRLSGKLNGEIAPTTPIGSRSVNASLPVPACDASIGTSSPRELACLDGREREGRHRPRGLDSGCLQRLAGLGRDRVRDLLVAAAELTGDPDEDLGSLVGRERLPHRRLGRVDGATRLRLAGLRHAPDHVAGVGRAHLDPVAGLDPLAGDQEPTLVSGRRHAASLGQFASRLTADSAGERHPVEASGEDQRSRRARPAEVDPEAGRSPSGVGGHAAALERSEAARRCAPERAAPAAPLCVARSAPHGQAGRAAPPCPNGAAGRDPRATTHEAG